MKIKKALKSQLHQGLVFYNANHIDKDAFQMQNIHWLIELFLRFRFKGKEWSPQNLSGGLEFVITRILNTFLFVYLDFCVVLF